MSPHKRILRSYRGCVDKIVLQPLADQPHSFSNSQFSGLGLSCRNSQRRMASPKITAVFYSLRVIIYESRCDQQYKDALRC
jgi:hypothetical protein